MSYRNFAVTLPADTNNHNLYSLLVGSVTSTNVHGYGLTEGGTNETGITGAIPTDGILPDRGTSLNIIASGSNTSTITVNDRNFANTVGVSLGAGGSFSNSSDRNEVCFKDFFIQGGAASQQFEVALDWV